MLDELNYRDILRLVGEVANFILRTTALRFPRSIVDRCDDRGLQCHSMNSKFVDDSAFAHQEFMANGIIT